MGGRIYGPHTGRYFASTRQTDIDYIVSFAEAHDTGLCVAGRLPGLLGGRVPRRLFLFAVPRRHVPIPAGYRLRRFPRPSPADRAREP